MLANNYDNSKLLLNHSSNPNAKDSVRTFLFIKPPKRNNTPMHFAVASKNLSIVRLLDEYNGDATIKNLDDVCAIDIAISEDFRDIKLHFMAQQKYKNFDFDGMMA